MARTRAAVGSDFIVIFRIAAMEMMDDGSSWDEVVQLGKVIEKAGATFCCNAKRVNLGED